MTKQTLVPLIDYIHQYYDGNQSAFARAAGVERQQIRQYLNAKKEVFVVDGKIVTVLRELND